jgi:hypothetical protein
VASRRSSASTTSLGQTPRGLMRISGRRTRRERVQADRQGC